MERDLFLVRHAKAGLSGGAQGDFGRPLNGRGRRAAVAVAAELARRGADPELILCSPAIRTRETLDRLLGQTAPPPVMLEPALYLAEASALLARLRALPSTVQRAMLVGHNDGLAELAVTLATLGAPATLRSLRAKYPAGAVAWLRLPLDDWSQLGRTRGELMAFIRPRDLVDG